MSRIEKTVFISYRRTNFWTALAVYKELHSNGFDVFFDYKNIPSGDFEQVITENVKSRAHFIVILSPSALDRCSEPNDWLRREIEIAIENKRNVIPLAMEGFDFGNPTITRAMTGSLINLKKYNAVSIPSEYFDEAMAKLNSERFLNRPLDSVFHPVSEKTKQITETQKSAANAAAPILNKQLTAQEWYERGYLFALKYDIDESIRCFTESIKLKPSYEAYFNRASARRQIGDPTGAIQDYDLAISLNPNEHQTYNNRGNARRDLGDLDGAISDYNRALALEPDASRALINRGVIQMAQRNLENARDDFIKAAKTSASPVEMSEARYNLGVTNRLSGKLEIAINDFKHVLSASPYHIMATAHLITILRKNKKESEAGEQERAIREIVQLENEYNQACFEAVCGNTEKALELLKIGLHNSQTTKDWARNNPDFENIRDDPRFKELIGE